MIPFTKETFVAFSVVYQKMIIMDKFKQDMHDRIRFSGCPIWGLVASVDYLQDVLDKL